MPTKPTTKRMTPAEQSAKFKEMARELGTDESPEAFDRTLKRLAPQKPPPKGPAKSKR